MSARIFAFFIWAAVTASLAFWGLRLTSQSGSVPAHAAPVESRAGVKGELTRLFGPDVPKTEAIPQATDPRYKLLGTMASSGDPSSQGWATIAVDDGPARTYQVGAKILGTDMLVHSVSLRNVTLGPQDGDATLTLQIAPLPAPATGSLSAHSSNNAGQPQPSPQMTPASPAPIVVPSPPALTPEALTSMRSQIMGRAMEAVNAAQQLSSPSLDQVPPSP
jgi:general secretion pathway protein C